MAPEYMNDEWLRLVDLADGKTDLAFIAMMLVRTIAAMEEADAYEAEQRDR